MEFDDFGLFIRLSRLSHKPINGLKRLEKKQVSFAAALGLTCSNSDPI